jgi:hypothetical protein
MLFLIIAKLNEGEWFQGCTKAALKLSTAFGDSANKSSGSCEAHNDLVCFRKIVCAQNQRLSFKDGHSTTALR